MMLVFFNNGNKGELLVILLTLWSLSTVCFNIHLIILFTINLTDRILSQQFCVCLVKVSKTKPLKYTNIYGCNLLICLSRLLAATTNKYLL